MESTTFRLADATAVGGLLEADAAAALAGTDPASRALLAMADPAAVRRRRYAMLGRPGRGGAQVMAPSDGRSRDCSVRRRPPLPSRPRRGTRRSAG